jgi:hypothetical protein
VIAGTSLLLALQSSVKYMVTGGVLLAPACAVAGLSMRRYAAASRGAITVG